jgi:ankyrin repeat protein
MTQELFRCVQDGKGDVGEILKRGANIHAKNAIDQTPLHVACIYQPDLVPALLEHGANINAFGYPRISPLHEACLYHPRMVPWLLMKGADPNLRDWSGKYPVDWITLSTDGERAIHALYKVMKPLDVPRPAFSPINRLYAGMIWNRFFGIPSSIMLDYM